MNAAKLFEQIDTDGSGTIEDHELLAHLAGQGQDDDSIDALFKALDVNGDGHISRDAWNEGFALYPLSVLSLLDLPTDALAAIAAKLLASPSDLAHLAEAATALLPIACGAAIDAARTQWVFLKEVNSIGEYAACARIIGRRAPALEFNQSRYTFAAGASVKLDEVAQLLLRHGRSVNVYLEGHTGSSEPGVSPAAMNDVAAGRCRVVAAALIVRGADPTRLRLRSWAKRVAAAESVCGPRVEIFFAAGETPDAPYPSRARYERVEATRGSVPIDDQVYDLVAQELRARPDLADRAVGWRGGAHSGADASSAAKHREQLRVAVVALDNMWHPGQRFV
jgi:outer membrane protein OmpA-like peptidoglycan-associated protein